MTVNKGNSFAALLIYIPPIKLDGLETRVIEDPAMIEQGRSCDVSWTDRRETGVKDTLCE